MLDSLILGLLCSPAAPPEEVRPNVLVLVIDDLGLDMLRAYDAENLYPPEIAEQYPLIYPATPNIDRLIENGVRFTQARVTPTCSSTRATLLSGRYPFRHGIGAIIRRADATPEYARSRTIEFGVGAENSEWTLAHLAGAAGYSSFLCGKWHLALPTKNLGLDGQPGQGWKHLREVGGFEDYWAVWGNLPGFPAPEPWASPGGRVFPPGYSNFVACENGRVENVRGEYVTTVQVNKLLSYVDAHAEDPWLIVSPFNACHSPHQTPPALLVQTKRYVERMREETRAARTDPEHEFSAWPFYMAMVEALDHEIGRLVEGLEERGVLDDTVIILMADNGTPTFVMQHAIEREQMSLGTTTRRMLVPNRERFKHTVWEPGVRVPLIVSGPVVGAGGRTSDVLVDCTDLFETIREILGVALADVVPEDHAIDGISFLPVLRSPEADAEHPRRSSLTEHFEPNGNPELILYERGKMSPKYMRRRGFVLRTERGTFKLVRNHDYIGNGKDRLYQLAGPEGEPVDPYELRPLPTGEDDELFHAVYLELCAELDQLLRSETRNWR